MPKSESLNDGYCGNRGTYPESHTLFTSCLFTWHGACVISFLPQEAGSDLPWRLEVIFRGLNMFSCGLC